MENSLLVTILMLFVVQELTSGITLQFAHFLNRTARIGIPILCVAYLMLIVLRLLSHSA